MTQSAKSVYYFGFYLVALALILLLQPNLLLGTFGLPLTDEVWIRVVGMLVLALSVYYMVVGKTGNTLFLSVTVYVRSSIIVFFTIFTLAGWVQPVIILFGAVDLLGAVWTYTALKKEGKL
ncbi:MAG: hypothetical protein AB7G44_07330 [Bacteroidia bacterium]